MFYSNKQIQFILTLLVVGFASSSTFGGDVSMSLTSREAYVGSPIQLQISINNASDYEQPTLPSVDGVEIRSAGVPSQSSQITIINGRRSESRSVVLRYLITARREGSFEIPSLKFTVDGKEVNTEAIKFVATKSETGDLLFVEIEGNKDKVFVGEPLDMTLKIYIKPYRNQEHDLTLSEGDMWNMISEQSAWGSFQSRMEELANNRQRPGGEEVLHDNGQGEERSYYMYEIDAQVYPTKAGKITGDDVQIVVDYPTGLGRSRDPFDSFFEDSPFGRGFMSSPFSNRLSVASSRPVVAEATVDATEVLPVPTEGRPADYRGAVGQYNIVAQASPVELNAGDSITLNLGIVGTGPMELVQAPPLSELPELKEFKISNQPLAGFVEDNSKLFSTTIRPKEAGITQIPAIPFSFFNPDTEKFETVHSEPIAITVAEAESLAVDAIVGTKNNHSQQHHEAPANTVLAPSFINSDSKSLLTSQSPQFIWNWWWLFVIAPPVVWVLTLITQHRERIMASLPSLRSPQERCVALITNAEEASSIADAFEQFLQKTFPTKIVYVTSANTTAVGARIGAMRSAGFYELAAETEALVEQLRQDQYAYGKQVRLEEQRRTAIELVHQIANRTTSKRKKRIRRPSTKVKKNGTRVSLSQHVAIFFAIALTTTSTTLQANDVSPTMESQASRITLNQSQQETLFNEANTAYRDGLSLAETDVIEAKDAFVVAAKKYQLLVDSGISNAGLYFNLGNAYLQSDQLGRAIINYERAVKYAPDNPQYQVNLEAAQAMVQQTPAFNKKSIQSAADLPSKVKHLNSILFATVGQRSIIAALVVSSLLFWGLVIARTCGRKFSLWKFATAPGLLLLVTLVSLTLHQRDSTLSGDAIIVAKQVQLHSGDSEQFDVVASLESAEGHRVHTLAHRGTWTQIETAHGHTGWVHDDVIEQL